MDYSQLKKIREGTGLSQVALAAKSGVSVQYIATLEQTGRVPGVDIALALAVALAVPVERLFLRLSTPGVDRYDTLEKLHCEEFDELSWEARRRVHRVLTAMSPDLAKSVLSEKKKWTEIWKILEAFERHLEKFQVKK